MTPATNSSPSAANRASLDGHGLNGKLLSTQRSSYLPSHTWLAHTRRTVPPTKFYPLHIRRYLRLGKLEWERLMDRAGLGDYKQERLLTRGQAKRVMKYHFVMLHERKPPVYHPNKRWAPPDGKSKRDRSLRRSVHPRLQSLIRDGQ